MKGRPQLSVVVLLYNEEECVMPLDASLVEVCDELNVVYELIFVDDGSQDQTVPRLKRFHTDDIRVKVIRFRKNSGQTAAMEVGFRYAKGKVIISMDGDLQNDPKDIPKCLQKMKATISFAAGGKAVEMDKFPERSLR